MMSIATMSVPSSVERGLLDHLLIIRMGNGNILPRTSRVAAGRSPNLLRMWLPRNGAVCLVDELLLFGVPFYLRRAKSRAVVLCCSLFRGLLEIRRRCKVWRAF